MDFRFFANRIAGKKRQRTAGAANFGHQRGVVCERLFFAKKSIATL